jgi:hypothetical protein
MPRHALTPDQLRDMTAGSTTEARAYATTPEGAGWLAFAGTMLAITGTLNLIYGIAGTSAAKFYGGDAAYVLGNLNTWGWVMIVAGSIQILAAFSIWEAHPFGRWVGVMSAGGNAIAQMLFLPAAPFLALSLFALDIAIIYGLVAYGGRRDELA